MHAIESAQYQRDSNVLAELRAIISNDEIGCWDSVVRLSSLLRSDRERFLSQLLRPVHEMAGQLCRDLGGKWCSSCFFVSTAEIKGREFFAEVDSLQVDETASGSTAIFLCRVHQSGAKPNILVSGINRQKADIRPLAPQFQIDTTDQRAVIFGDKKLSCPHHVADLSLIDAVAFDKERLCPVKCGVDHDSDRRGILQACGANCR
ncbi:MAG TPA: hypothetical protein VFO39_14505 [Candidatus Sulfotelmatobacter sp.]|nr:hypothetical protein [Candidatus Sulfotelmatobacter sp.]